MHRRPTKAALMAMLGVPSGLPQRSSRFRNATLTLHDRDTNRQWVWSGQDSAGHPDGEMPMSALIFISGAATVDGSGEHYAIDATGAVLLCPGRAVSVDREGDATAMCVWVPWDALAEIDDGNRRLPMIIDETALSAGLRSFAVTLIRRDGTPSQHSEYIIERLIAEMVFGVVLEASESSRAGARQIRPIDRARSLMLLRRGDPAFGIDDVAKDQHVSVRQLQRVFARVDSSPSDELRRLRVELARDLLSDSLYAPLSVEQIADHSGFSSAAAMRRAFAASGLPTPQRARDGWRA